ncbi:MAG TPA: hypothetical protein VLJ39_10255 [Tepidisphaeraceae bacterium]|nr:hypothetical protein [Tepidisphaeraceae bacterium]
MIAKAARNPERAIGRAPDQLTIAERAELTGKYVALEIYTPDTLPLRRIEAIGDSIEECIRILKSRGLDPLRFQYTRITPAY